jgi:hypothetical protein
LPLAGPRAPRLRFVRFLRLMDAQRSKNRNNSNNRKGTVSELTGRRSRANRKNRRGPLVASDEIAVAIEERAAPAGDRVPAVYLDAWARFQCQRPFSVDPDPWQRAINDAGLFLDGWGAEAAAAGWTAGALFDVPRDGCPGGIVWRLAGGRVESVAADRVRLNDGRYVRRETGAANV